MTNRTPRLAALVLAGTVVLACADRSETAAGPATGPSFSAASGQDALARVIAIQNRNTGRLMATAGVVGTATGLGADGQPAVLVLARAPGLTGIPRSLEGANVEVWTVGDIEAIRPERGGPGGGGGGVNLKAQIRPVPNGVSVGNNNECAAGTLGAAVLLGGAQYALSNNHVFARENAAAVGEPLVQPGRYDNKPKCANEGGTDAFGTLAAFEPIVFSTLANNVMDAAIVVATTPLTCGTPAGFYGSPSSTTTSASLGLAVQKVGRTSGRTAGTITAINATVNVGYPAGTARFVGQMVTSGGFSKSGDSGSLIVTNDGTNRPVGLLFAGTNDGTTIGNPIDPVLARFNVSICSL